MLLSYREAQAMTESLTSRVVIFLRTMFLLAAFSGTLHADEAAKELLVEQLPALPQTEGFAGAFTGISDGHLLVMGGANFPNGKPWEGGTKVWYRSIYAARLEDLKATTSPGDKPSDAEPLTSESSPWKIIGQLPGERGYGLAVTHRDRIICIGGNNSTSHLSDVIAVCLRNQQLHVETLPSLPMTLANFSGALDRDMIYVAGGQETATSVTASEHIWMLNLSEPQSKWTELPLCPGPARILATSAAGQGSFWLIGGASLREGSDGKPVRTYLSDVWKYSCTTGWEQMADLPAPLVGCPSPTLLMNGDPVIFGGDDGTQVGHDPQKHNGFRKAILRYVPGSDSDDACWSEIGQLPFGSVTTNAVPESRSIWIPTGEIRPGIRTPNILKVSLP